MCYAGALVQTVEQDDKMDSAVISLMLIAQERITTVVTPPEAVPHQPLTLALLQVILLWHPLSQGPFSTRFKLSLLLD